MSGHHRHTGGTLWFLSQRRKNWTETHCDFMVDLAGENYNVNSIRRGGRKINSLADTVTPYRGSGSAAIAISSHTHR